MSRPHALRALAQTVLLAAGLAPSVASALPPTFLPGPSEPSDLKPGKVMLHARWAGGVEGSFDPALSPNLDFTPSGGGELGLSDAVRTTLDGHAGFSLQRGADGKPTPSRTFAGGRWGLRIIGPTGKPELGFGVGGGAIGRFAGGAAAAPSAGYVSADFELGMSESAGPGFVSAVARFGPSVEIHPGAERPVLPSFSALGELTAGVELEENFYLTFAATLMIGYDGTTTSVNSQVGSPYAGLVGNIGFVVRPGK